MTRHRPTHDALVASLRRRAAAGRGEGAIYRRGRRPDVGSAARRRRARHLRALGPVPLPLCLGRYRPGPRLVRMLGVVVLSTITVRSATGVHVAGLAAWGVALLAELLRVGRRRIVVGPDHLRVRDPSTGRVQTVARADIVCLVDDGHRMGLRLRSHRGLVPLPARHLAAEERFLLARCLTHYDLGHVFA